MKYLEDSRLTQLTSDLTGAVLNTRGTGNGGIGGGSSAWTVAPSSLGGGGNGNNRSAGGGGGGGGGKKTKKQRLGGGGSNGGGGSTSNHRQRGGTAGGGGGGGANHPSSVGGMPSSLFYVGGGCGGGGGGGGGNASGGCRVMYGRVEAWTTKRAGSDKKTAAAVGERYAHEMERLNEAVEALKRRHALERGELPVEMEGDMDMGEGEGIVLGSSMVDGEDGETTTTRTMESTKPVFVLADRRVRSCSVDDRSSSKSDRVTFASSSSSFARPHGQSINEEDDVRRDGGEGRGGEIVVSSSISNTAKRDRPLGGGILRSASSSTTTTNKRCRAMSFDISTGPSSSSAMSISGIVPSRGGGGHWSASSSSYPGVDYHGNANNDDDPNTRPLIPQPSLYQSTLGEHHGEKNVGIGPTMVPRRLLTDLILTLNASFPDYDFGDAQVSDFCTLSTTEAMRRINDRLSEFAATTNEGRDFLPRLWTTLDDLLFDGLRDCEVYSYAPQGCSGDDPLDFLTMSMTEESGGTYGGGGDVGVEGRYFRGPRGQTVMFDPIGGGGAIVSGDIILNDGLDTSSMLNHISPSGLGESPPHVTLWSMNYLFVSHNKKRIVLFACVQTMRTPQGNDDDVSAAEYDEYGENDVVFDEARREEEEDCVNTPSRTDRSGKSTPIGDESVSVMVDDTDFDEGSVDVDGEVDQGEHDFDTGTMGISIGVPSQIS